MAVQTVVGRAGQAVGEVVALGVTGGTGEGERAGAHRGGLAAAAGARGQFHYAIEALDISCRCHEYYCDFLYAWSQGGSRQGVGVGKISTAWVKILLDTYWGQE